MQGTQTGLARRHSEPITGGSLRKIKASSAACILARPAFDPLCVRPLHLVRFSAYLNLWIFGD